MAETMIYVVTRSQQPEVCLPDLCHAGVKLFEKPLGDSDCSISRENLRLQSVNATTMFCDNDF
jgi:hypothetical protein